jgi:hypothetical protein
VDRRILDIRGEGEGDRTVGPARLGLRFTDGRYGYIQIIVDSYPLNIVMVGFVIHEYDYKYNKDHICSDYNLSRLYN